MPKYTFAIPTEALQEVTVEAANFENAKALVALGDGEFGPLCHDPDAEANTDTSTYFEVNRTEYCLRIIPDTVMGRKFKQVFADGIIPNMTQKQLEEAMEQRQLQWKGDRISLSEASEITAGLQSLIRSQALTKLLQEFPDIGQSVGVNLAREYSMAIYLHFPRDGCVSREDVKKFVDLHFQADEVDFQSDGSLRIWWD